MTEDLGPPVPEVAAATYDYVPSPCTGQCRIDPGVPGCRGCGRTMDEIQRWPDADSAQRRAILAGIAARRPRGLRRIWNDR